jgi:uncharacterized protein (TIGR03437 family)
MTQSMTEPQLQQHLEQTRSAVERLDSVGWAIAALPGALFKASREKATIRAYSFLACITLLPMLSRADPAYFRIGDASGSSIIVRVDQAAAIARAREALAGRSGPVIMTGKIVPVPAFDNPGWNFHVDPITVEFVDSAAEVCDSSIAGVERALNEVGGSVLPDFRWCLWSTKVLAELPIPEGAAKHARHASAADHTELTLAPGSLAVAFAPGLVPQTSVVSVTLKDSAGGQWIAAPLFVSPGSVTYQMPSGLVPGPVTAVIATSEGSEYVDSLYVLVFAPSLFSVMPPGIAAAWVTRFKADGSISVEPVFRFDSGTQTVVAAPIDLGPTTDEVYLSLLGTGIRNRPDLGSIQIFLGRQSPLALYAGPQSAYTGVDQINLVLPRALAGSGMTAILISSTLPDRRTLKSEAVQLVFQ